MLFAKKSFFDSKIWIKTQSLRILSALSSGHGLRGNNFDFEQLNNLCQNSAKFNIQSPKAIIPTSNEIIFEPKYKLDEWTTYS